MFPTYEEVEHPGYRARLIADSANGSGDRITTFELTYPRIVHAELMTHRLFSRNSASSRAIPNKKLIERIQNEPVMPAWWGKNQSGMQAKREVDNDVKEEAKRIWLEARDLMVGKANELHRLGLHKQLANRILEPWMFITVIVTATEYENWFALRHDWPDPDQPPGNAQPEIAWVARAMNVLSMNSEPELKHRGAWHLPYVDLEDKDHPLYVDLNDSMINYDIGQVIKICTARCARVSYLTHDGVRDLSKDIELHDMLSKNGHWSPFEHPAQALSSSKRVGNFVGWHQYRKTFANEHFGRDIG